MQTPQPPKVLKKCDLNPQTLEKLKLYFGRFFINSLEIVISQQKFKSKNSKMAQIFITSYSFLNIFSFIMSYDCPMLLCINVSIGAPISIRYSLKSLISQAKTAKPRKMSQFFKNFNRILRKITFSYGGFISLSFHIKYF